MAKLGDFDADGVPTVLDLQRLINHVNRSKALSADSSLLADMNQDGFINDTDVSLLANAILGLTSLPELPLTTIRETSPSSGETGVTVTRETVFRFNYPLSASTFLTSSHLYAEFGGRKLLSRIELSSDRKTVTLFYLENLPGGARVRVTFNPIVMQDVFGRLVDLDGDGQAGGVRVIDFDTASTTPVNDTAIIGYVFASQQVTNGTNLANLPLRGVTVTVDGMEETMRVVTDSNGFFRLSPCPAGEFFVHIDGRTLTNAAAGIHWPDLSYYPYVGKAWTAVAGQTNNLAGGTGVIYLPLIVQGTLQTVSTTNDTLITFPASVSSNNPALAGVTVLVPSNSLFSANGTRGGSVGIAPVPADRLPGPLPPGLNLPLVITVQTSGGENFDRPVPVRFPNLPDPVTGVRLPPGAKSALWSFNHDTGEWQIVGSMTVTADGLYVESDVGVGILQPGWHGTAPGVGGKGGKILKKKKRPCPLNGGICDDGDDCTKNDRCESGECTGTPPADSAGMECEENAAAPIEFSGWTETSVAADGNITSPAGFDARAITCYDSASGSWKLQATRLISKGRINLTMSGSEEPDMSALGGNITESNYCRVIEVLAGYLGRGRAVGDWGWHTAAASRAHEYYHRDVELKGIIEPLWRDAEALMESSSVPCSKTLAEANAILWKNQDDAFSAMMAKWRAAWNAPSDHDTLKIDGPYQAGQAELNKTIAEIRAYATEEDFDPCPTPSPMPSLARAKAAEVQLLQLDASISSGLIDVGATAQINVIGHFSDGSSSNLTLHPGTRYSVGDASIASINSAGLVQGVTAGRATTLFISFIPGVDILPKVTTVNVAVRSPGDIDNDGMPDVWERAHGMNPNDPTDADKDADGDGVTNLQEYKLGSDPRNRDTDGDGVSDGQELIDGSNPTGSAVPDPTLQTGLHYYVLVNLDTLAIQRGIAGDSGVAFKNLILAPNTHYRVFILQSSTLNVGSSDFTTPSSGANIILPAIILHPPSTSDSDGDGLPDDAEWIMGTNQQTPDSDGDGIQDGAEVQQGTDPLSNLAVRTGIVASVDTPGKAVDVCAVNDIAIVADSSAGITLFSVANGLNPTRIAQVDTPGNAVAVACSGNIVAVADDTAGLALIDITDPPAARIVRQINLAGAVRAVAASGGIAYAGLASGQVVSVDMASGTILERVALGSAVQDVAIGGDTLYVLRVGTLDALPLNADALRVAGSAPSPGNVGAGGRRLRLFVGGSLAYASHTQGYNTFDLSNPASPALIQPRITSQFGWIQIVANGSGLAVAAVGPNSTDDGPHDVSLYNVGAAGTNNQFLTTFETPGLATAVAIYNGLAYVADGLSGLQVVNYISYDSHGLPPSISLSASFPLNPAISEEGKTVRVTADVADDVQVRNVEFYVDGVRVALDGNFPFEYRFVTPLLAPAKTNFNIRARASDTGGNATWSQEITVQLVPDATPPSVAQVFPAPGAILGQADLLAAYFNEPVAPATLGGTTIQLQSAGADARLDTADDVWVTNGVISYNDQLNAVFVNFPTNLPAAFYRAYVNPPLADLAGNPLAASFRWQFWITGGRDTDQDGIPDDIEVAMGLNPNNPDSDGDGILDGDEDFDGDGLATKWELLFGYDPRVPDSDGNGVFDGDEDLDNDGLTNLQEQARHTNPANADTDGDGWPDEAEVTGGSDPLNPNSRPRLYVVCNLSVSVRRPDATGREGFALNVTIARPTAAVVLPGSFGSGALAGNVIVAHPTASVVLPGALGAAGIPIGVTIGKPAVTVNLPSAIGASLPPNVTVAHPPASIVLPGSFGRTGLTNNTTIAKPLAKVRIAGQ